MCSPLLASSRHGGLESSRLNFNSFQMLLFPQQLPMLTTIPDMASGFLYNQTPLWRYWRLLTTFYKRLKESSWHCKIKDRHIRSLCSKKIKMTAIKSADKFVFITSSVILFSLCLLSGMTIVKSPPTTLKAALLNISSQRKDRSRLPIPWSSFSLFSPKVDSSPHHRAWSRCLCWI